MPTPILATKLYAPPPRPNLVPRLRLYERLTEGLHGKLTLISAPAGFGKTTLVSSWIHTIQSNTMGQEKAVNQVAWLSLDYGDSDTSRFLAYLVAALQTINPAISEGALALLQSPQPPPIETILTTLLNDVTNRYGRPSADHLGNDQHKPGQGFLLVLDDYHVLDSPSIDEALTFLLDHQPPQMHVVMMTREDPPLPLARYRVRGELVEVRAADLRFTPTEAADFLNQGMGLPLSADEIAALESRTEGWIAGLQMAALSMQGHTDRTDFIQTFMGSHRFVLDYLVEEVLQHQPEQVRKFLLQTAILDRLSGPLCDAVTGGKDSRSMLETLERGNLFVIPLDDERQWYRYHHLFANVLQTRLLEEQSAQISTLHQRASVWYEQINLPADAIHHALAGTDFLRAADLIELARPIIEKGRRDVTFRGWVQALPDELVRTRPVLNAGYALALLDEGELDDVESRLDEVEGWLEIVADGYDIDVNVAEMIVVDEAQLQALPASIATARVLHSLASGDISGTIKYAQQALNRLPMEDHLRRGQITGLLGLAYWAIGDLEVAQQAMLEAGALTQKAGTILDTIPGIFVVADIQVARGQLREAIRTYEHALQLAAEHGEPTSLGLENVYSGLSDLHREQGDLAAAARALATSKTLGERFGERLWRCRWCIVQARLEEALGDLDGTLNHLNKAEHLYILNPLSHVHPVAALRARIWIKQGRLTAALAWVRERDLSVDDDLSYAHEFEHITLARLLIAQDKSDQEENVQADGTIHRTEELLARLLQAAEDGGRMGSVIEILMLMALTHATQDDNLAAAVALERALTLAEPEGYVHLFVDEGPPMAQLLREAATQRSAPDYTHKLLAVFEAKEQASVDAPSPFHPSSNVVVGGTPSSPQPLIEPLSERELDVLRLLQTELSGPEIARELVVALSTVRTHTKSIYSKLNVNNRRAAVKRADDLGLI